MTFEIGVEFGMEKAAGRVAVPEGGLRAGMWMNDLTQVMTPDDAEMVRARLPFHRRSAPGLLPMAALGAASLGMVGRIAGSEFGRKGRAVGTAAGAILGGVALPALAHALTRSGRYDQQAVEAAKKVIEEAKRRK
jgi:uncharacterized protein YcfJ